jgi:hypothetical protein
MGGFGAAGIRGGFGAFAGRAGFGAAGFRGGFGAAGFRSGLSDLGIGSSALGLGGYGAGFGSAAFASSGFFSVPGYANVGFIGSSGIVRAIIPGTALVLNSSVTTLTTDQVVALQALPVTVVQPLLVATYGTVVGAQLLSVCGY